MERLKPCPFCGGKVSVTYNSAERAFCFWHETVSCVIEEPFKIDRAFAGNLEEAAEVWNRRNEDGEVH